MKRAIPLLSLILCLALLAGCANGTSITVLDEQTPIDINNPPTEPPVDELPRALSDDPDVDFIAPAPDAYEPSGEDTQPGTEGAAPAQPNEDSAAANARITRPIDLTYGVVVGEDAALHPLRTTYTDFNSLNALMFEGLVELDESLKPVPMLAEHWTVEGDEWTFTLRRENVRFHDGALLSAADVVASYEEALRYTDTVWYPLLTNNVAGMIAQDDLTVRVKAAGGVGYMLLYAMTFPVVQRSSIDTSTPRGTGPFWLISYHTSEYVHLESNPIWWRKPNDDVHVIFVICYATSREAMAALETGEIDAFATRNTIAALSRSLSDRMTFDYSTTRYECIVPNLRGSILSRPKVREALMYGIDRTTLANTAYMGMVQESEVPVVPGSWLSNAQATRYNYSPERALQLLQEDGWVDTNGDGILEKEIDGIMADLELTLLTYNEGNSPIRAEAAYAIADQLLKVGVRVNVSALSRSEAGKKLNDHDFQLALISYNLSLAPNLRFLLSPSGSGNYSGYNSEPMDILLQSAHRAAGEEELISAMNQIQMKVIEDLPIMGLFFRTGVLVSKERIGGLSGLREGHTLRGIEKATFE